MASNNVMFYQVSCNCLEENCLKAFRPWSRRCMYLAAERLELILNVFDDRPRCGASTARLTIGIIKCAYRGLSGGSLWGYR
jgi:hypothetical protein